MLKNWKRRLIVFGIPLTLVVLLYFTSIRQRDQYCTGVNVILENPEAGTFLTEQEVVHHLNKLNDTLEGKNTHDIDVAKLERQLMNMPFVAKADVYFTLHGVLKIRMQQRAVVARLYDAYNTTAYLANDGTIMPVAKGSRHRVLVASGEIRDSLQRLIGKNIHQLKAGNVLHEVHALANYIHNDTILSALIAQATITQHQEIELIPSIDDHTILIGNADSLAYKFRKLLAFYQKGMTRTGWDTYSQINLKYSNQVICTNKQ
jgi:cell division protein FtsQ